ncbi:MAG: hypothetical protein QF645_12500 [Planctomycetota bacterium]|nr:hypothetical protein [Planctomycetota bacterium]
MGQFISDYAPLNQEGELCPLFGDRKLMERCLDIRDPKNTNEYPAFQELKKQFRDTIEFRESGEIPDILDQLFHVSQDPELRTRITFNEEMVPGYNCISLHQVIYELLREENEDLLDFMEPTMRVDEVTGKSYIDESKVEAFLQENREELSKFSPDLIALYFGCFAFLHEHRERESAILDPLLSWGEPYLGFFGATPAGE